MRVICAGGAAVLVVLLCYGAAVLVVLLVD
jgi:hypothetical protein